MKKYLTTIIKYLFSVLLLFISLKTTKDFKFVLAGLIELATIFALSDFLVSKSKFFNILNSLLMFIFNAELVMLLFGNSFITFVMLQNLTSLEDLQGKIVVYGIGVVAVVICSFLPVKHIEKIKHYPIIAFPLLLIVDVALIAGSEISYSPYAGARDLCVQVDDYNNMKKMLDEFKADSLAETDELSEEEYYAEDYLDDEEYYEETTDAEMEDMATAAENKKVKNVSSNKVKNTRNQTAVESMDQKIKRMYPVGTPTAHNTLPAGTNVIVVFVEGLSNNIITDERAIMPNLAAFSNECIKFKNYYNHTFATYRGIQGQLYSGYSLDDYESNRQASVMTALKGKGYTTAFINVEPSNKQFTNYLNAMDFDKVYSEFSNADGVAGSLSDRMAYDQLYNIAEQYSKKGQPFFLGMYSFGTHVSFDADENQFGDGSNNFMNRYHNCDVQIGSFIEKFKESPFAKNTMLIITADHACYVDEDFRKTFPAYYRAHGACDVVPLYIYYNGIAMTLDASGRNTLDLSPTILDLLGVESPAAFTGASLYAAKNEKTILDTFFWNTDGCSYTGDCQVTVPSAEINKYVQGEIVKYLSAK